ADGKKLAASLHQLPKSTNTICVWDLTTGKVINKRQTGGFPAPGHALAFSRDGSELVVSSRIGVKLAELSKDAAANLKDQPKLWVEKLASAPRTFRTNLMTGETRTDFL